MAEGPKPIRLKVGYKTPEKLLGELTKSVGRGGVRIESKKALAVGTKFVFELRCVGLKTSVEINGTVASVTQSAPGVHVLHIRYEPPKERTGIEAVLQKIFASSEFDKKRKHPRIPLAVRAVEGRADSKGYRLRDLSMGGVGLAVEGDELPPHLKVGEAAFLQMKLMNGTLSLHGEIVWIQAGVPGKVPPRAGVQFGQLQPKAEKLLADLLSLRVLPAPPWIARLAFGREAVEQMTGFL